MSLIEQGELKFDVNIFNMKGLRMVLKNMSGYETKLEFLKKMRREVKIILEDYKRTNINFRYTGSHSFTIHRRFDRLAIDIDFCQMWSEFHREKVTLEKIKDYVSGRGRFYRKMIEWIDDDIESLKQKVQEIV